MKILDALQEIALDNRGLVDEELEDSVLVDAFIIFRSQRPTDEVPRIGYIGAQTLSDEVRIGILTMVNDRIRAAAVDGWTD